MPRIWMLRNVTNFAVSVVGLTTLGFFWVTAYKQSYYSHPTVLETIKILNEQQKLKGLIGYPISYKSTLNNSYEGQNQQKHFRFQVMGPRGSTIIEMAAVAKPAGELYSYGEEQKEQVEQKIKKISGQIQQLEGKIKKQNNKKQKRQLELNLKLLIQNKQLAESQKEKIRQNKINQQQRYYIPDTSLYSTIGSFASQEDNTYLDKQFLLWKIDKLVAQLPNHAKIVIDCKNQGIRSNEMQQYPTYKLLNKKLRTKLDQLSQQELEHYSKTKTRFIYTRYELYRITSMVAVFALVSAIYIYFKKNMLKSMSGSVFMYIAEKQFKAHPLILDLCRKKNVKCFNWDYTISGGLRNDRFHCFVSVRGLTMGQVQLSGTYDSKNNEYKYEKFVLKWIQDNKSNQINLLQ